MEEITKGTAHPLESVRYKVRDFLLSHGFDEIRLRDENWEETIASLRKKKELPLKVFTRSEFVIVGSSIATCTDIMRDLFRSLELKNTEEENKFFVEHANEKIPIAEIKQINETPPSFLVTLKEREMAREISGKNTMEEMLYPQFHEKPFMTDEQIASIITIARRPETDLGKVISDAIVKTAEEKCQQLSPCRFRAYGRELREGKLEIWLIQPGDNKKLCGPDFLNRICIYAGNVLTLPPVREKGIKTGISFIKAFADYVANAVENINEDYKLIKVGNVENWRDINLVVPDIVQNFVAENDKAMDIKGALNLTAEIKFRKW